MYIIEEYEIIDELAASKRIIDRFKAISIKTIKEKLELDLEFLFDYGINLKLSIGNAKNISYLLFQN